MVHHNKPMLSLKTALSTGMAALLLISSVLALTHHDHTDEMDSSAVSVGQCCSIVIISHSYPATTYTAPMAVAYVPEMENVFHGMPDICDIFRPPIAA